MVGTTSMSQSQMNAYQQHQQQLATNTSLLLCSQAPLGTDCCCCKRCGVAGCDLKVMPCGCCLHARCCPVSENSLLSSCPVCHNTATGLLLMPMSFIEIDQATSEASETNLSSKRGKKRQNATVLRLNPMIKTAMAEDAAATGTGVGGHDGAAAAGGGGDGSAGESADLRTGRWTAEETSYCDKLIAHFETGNLPIPEGIKLNDFLSNMLKSKQSRLTKKMKNARLSAKQYRRQAGYIVTDLEAREFSQLEVAFFASIKCNMERCEIKFHMQEVWRELFSAYCTAIGQKLDVDAWLSSVEEMDHRNAVAKNAARRARRKVMTGVALTQDTRNTPTGVFIDPGHDNDDETHDPSSQLLMDKNGECLAGPFGEDDDGGGGGGGDTTLNKRSRRIGGGAVGGAFPSRNRQSMAGSSSFHTAPFVGKVIQYVQRRGVPFEHVDVWVPSVVTCTTTSSEDSNTNEQPQQQQQQQEDDQKCRLCFGGCATSETKIPPDSLQPVAMTSHEQFDLISFGEYSQKFSFAVGCGLPGRVYSSGVPSWERGIQSAPQSLFERGGGATQWGIETALGIPVPSPNVGRVVVVLYSRHDRPRDTDLVTRIAEELARFMPSPRWKLVVEVGVPAPIASNTTTGTVAVSAMEDNRVKDLLEILRKYIPVSTDSPFAPYLPGFTLLRLLLLKSTRTPYEVSILQLALGAFESYRLEGRSDSDVASMTARDCMILTMRATTSLTPQIAVTNIIQPQHAVHATLLPHQYQANEPTQQTTQQQQYHALQQQVLQCAQQQQQQAVQQAQQQSQPSLQHQHAPTTSTRVSTCDPKTGCCPAPSMAQQQYQPSNTNSQTEPTGISPLNASELSLPQYNLDNKAIKNSITQTPSTFTTACGPTQQQPPQFDPSQFNGELGDEFSVFNEDTSSFHY